MLAMQSPYSQFATKKRTVSDAFSKRVGVAPVCRHRGLRATIVVTEIGAVIGVGAFNATVLNNMLASCESGGNVSAAQAQIQRQAEETAALVRQIQQRLPAPAKK